MWRMWRPKADVLAQPVWQSLTLSRHAAVHDSAESATKSALNSLGTGRASGAKRLHSKPILNDMMCVLYFSWVSVLGSSSSNWMKSAKDWKIIVKKSRLYSKSYLHISSKTMYCTTFLKRTQRQHYHVPRRNVLCDQSPAQQQRKQPESAIGHWKECDLESS